MAQNNMTALTLSGPAEHLDEAIEAFIMGRDIHPEDAVSFLAGMRRLEKPTEPNPYAAPLREAEGCLETLGIARAYAPFEEADYTAEGCADYLAALRQKLAAADTERERLAEMLREWEEGAAQMKHIASVEESFDDLVELRYVHCRFGRIHPQNRAALETEIAPADGMVVFETDAEPEWSWILVLSTRSQADRVDALLARFGFERILPDEESYGEKTPQEILSDWQGQMDEAREHLAALDAAGGELLASEREELLRRYSYLKFKNTCFEARQYAGLGRGRFYLVGWVESDAADAFAAEVEARPGFTCLKASAGEVPDAVAPVKMKKRRFGGVFDAIVRMYGLPADGERDPRLFLAITYTLFFGIMFGDVGQGACLILAGFLIWKKTGGSIWRIFSVCGVSSVIFGLFYGSLFGLEDVFPWGGFHVLEGENLMTTLIAAVALGVCVLLVCMIFNVINSLSRKDYQSAFFGPNGISGMVFYIAVVALVVSMFTGMFAFPKWAIWVCIVLPLVLIWVGAPLGKLLAGDPSWKSEGIGSVLMDGFFEIFEALLSYLSNTMSFLRVGAFAVSHAGMMMVVYLIGETAGKTGSIAVAIFGNIFVACLEAGLASIQIIRLQFYEMFGRYYSGRGRAFKTLRVQYK